MAAAVLQLQTLPVPARVVTREEAREYFGPLTSDKNLSVRAKAVRAIMALMKDGQCNICHREVEDYNQLYRWHFDHLDDLQYFPVSTRTGIRQFRISGKDIATRSLALVIDHCRDDTQLLCKNCHYKKTRATFLEGQRVARISHLARNMGVHMI